MTGRHSIFLILTALTLGWALSGTLFAYRVTVFNIVPRDDYSEYVLFVTHKGELGGVPGSPFKERILSVLIAAPFYYVVPPIRFSLMDPNTKSEILRANLSLSVVNYLTFILGSALLARACWRKHKDYVIGICTFALSTFYASFLAMNGVDGVATGFIAFILAAFCHGLRTPTVFLVIVGPFVNEKIILFVVPFLGVVSIFDKRWVLPLIFAVVAGLAYLVIRIHFGVGNEAQISISVFYSNFIQTISSNLSLKGVALGLVQIVCVVLPVIVAMRSSDLRSRYIAAAGICAIGALSLASMIANVQFNIGRIIAHAAPVSWLSISMVLAEVRQKSHLLNRN